VQSDALIKLTIGEDGKFSPIANLLMA